MVATPINIIRINTHSDTDVIFFYGHVHDVASSSLEQYGRDTTIIAQSLGCLCQPMNCMQGAPDKWQQAFAVFEFMPSEDFGYSVVRITDHSFVFDGKIYAA
jgi:hypothetical protein